jgi:hypothetical protein
LYKFQILICKTRKVINFLIDNGGGITYTIRGGKMPPGGKEAGRPNEDQQRESPLTIGNLSGKFPVSLHPSSG